MKSKTISCPVCGFACSLDKNGKIMEHGTIGFNCVAAGHTPQYCEEQKQAEFNNLKRKSIAGVIAKGHNQ